MAEFNINNSEIEQMNSEGDNIKVTGNKGSVAVTKGEGQTVQTTGNENKVRVEPKESVWAQLWKKIKGWFGY
jgi:hypothetical protein